MKQSIIYSMLAVTIVIVTSCSPDNETFSGDNGIISQNGNISNATSVTAELGGLTSFVISTDNSSLGETVIVDETDDDYVENTVFSRTVSVAYNGDNVSISGDGDGVTVVTDGADVCVSSNVKFVNYILSGSTSNGRFKLYSDNKSCITLNGVSINNNSGAAINIQSKKRTFIISSDGTTNTLADGTTYTAEGDEDMKGTIFSEGQIVFSGNGNLTIDANCKAGIASDQYVRFMPATLVNIDASAGNGIKVNDDVIITGGVRNIKVSASGKKGINSEGHVHIDGGRTTIITSGNGIYDSDDNDVTACAGIKCDSTLYMTDGKLYINSSGTGGKGISTDGQITISGGEIKIITSGAQYKYSNSLTAKSKGIKSDSSISISGGSIMVRATGGEGSEGIESKSTINMTGGEVSIYSYDDCMNSSSNMTISGGSLFAYAISNDAIDSNGNITISGGTIVASGASQPEGAIDCDSRTVNISGGTVIATGGDNSSCTSSSQPVICYGGSFTNNSTIAICDSEGATVLSYLPSRSLSGEMIISSPELEKNKSYKMYSGLSVSGGTDFYGLNTTGTASGGSETYSFTLSSYVTSIGNSTGSMNNNSRPFR